MSKFLIEYDIDGASWGLTLDATDWPDAERRLAVLGNARILGPIAETIPAEQAGSFVNTAVERPRLRLVSPPPVSSQDGGGE